MLNLPATAFEKKNKLLEYREERGGAENEDEEQRRCALAIESMMIAAASFGLGSCYSGFGAMVKGNPEVVEALEMNENEQIYGPILIGYPKNELTDALSDALERICATKKEPITKWL